MLGVRSGSGGISMEEKNRETELTLSELCEALLELEKRTAKLEASMRRAAEWIEWLYGRLEGVTSNKRISLRSIYKPIPQSELEKLGGTVQP